uniref:Uncharacterized protein n=1 Tax=viral metagenome TaxID=1070528 RepID=A0A6C0HN79_9ZZZZ
MANHQTVSQQTFMEQNNPNIYKSYLNDNIIIQLNNDNINNINNINCTQFVIIINNIIKILNIEFKQNIFYNIYSAIGIPQFNTTPKLTYDTQSATENGEITTTDLRTCTYYQYSFINENNEKQVDWIKKFAILLLKNNIQTHNISIYKNNCINLFNMLIIFYTIININSLVNCYRDLVKNRDNENIYTQLQLLYNLIISNMNINSNELNNFKTAKGHVKTLIDNIQKFNYTANQNNKTMFINIFQNINNINNNLDIQKKLYIKIILIDQSYIQTNINKPKSWYQKLKTGKLFKKKTNSNNTKVLRTKLTKYKTNIKNYTLNNDNIDDNTDNIVLNEIYNSYAQNLIDTNKDSIIENNKTNFIKIINWIIQEFRSINEYYFNTLNHYYTEKTIPKGNNIFSQLNDIQFFNNLVNKTDNLFEYTKDIFTNNYTNLIHRITKELIKQNDNYKLLIKNIPLCTNYVNFLQYLNCFYIIINIQIILDIYTKNPLDSSKKILLNNLYTALLTSIKSMQFKSIDLYINILSMSYDKSNVLYKFFTDHRIKSEYCITIQKSIIVKLLKIKYYQNISEIKNIKLNSSKSVKQNKINAIKTKINKLTTPITASAI